LEFAFFKFKTKIMIKELEQDNLQQLISDNETVIVQYSAGWCGNCRIMKPKFKKLATENENITFVMADAEKFPDSRKLATVDNLPTFATFKNGVFVSQVQTNKFEALKDLVNEVTSN
jgi:thiol-disulfide isomerase/thioredoxin